MDYKDITLRLNAVINTLGAATIRADQVDAVQRIHACTQELRSVIAALEAAGKDAEAKEAG